MTENHGTTIVEARAAWSLDEDAKCRQPEGAEDGLEPFRANDGVLGETGYDRKKE